MRIEYLITLVGSAAITFGLIVLSLPLLRQYALARPTARSSHKVPTPQGGGIFIVAATIGVATVAIFNFQSSTVETNALGWVLGATVGLAIVGAIDDLRVLQAATRLVLQAAAVATVIATLPDDFRIVPALSWWPERILMLVGGIWFVNLVNFMDGVDWMTVAEVLPLAAGLAGFGLLGALPPAATFISLALCGAIIGFAPFNRPVAQLFLGDVGSLPIGLLLGWLLALLAGNGHLAAAVLLPLYYLADATVTLLRRLINREAVTQAHRSHFYQRALDGGIGIYRIIGSVFCVNIVLLGLAAATILTPSLPLHYAALATGCLLVGALLWRFDRA